MSDESRNRGEKKKKGKKTFGTRQGEARRGRVEMKRAGAEGGRANRKLIVKPLCGFPSSNRVKAEG